MSDEKLSAGAVRYKQLKERNPEYLDEYWERCRSFYKGGNCLLENDSVMERVFPQHNNEVKGIYNLRKSVAFYMNYAGEIIDELLAKLNSHPLRMKSENASSFYEGFLESCGPVEKEDTRYGDLLMRMLLTAMQCGKSWCLVDMPTIDHLNLADNLAEQETSGALNAWCLEIQPECVVDWEMDEQGVLEWALLCYKSSRRDSLFGSRDNVTETYIMYDKDSWKQWQITYPKDKPPKDEKEVMLTGEGDHGFGCVPLVQLTLPDGLWAMGKLESLAKEHFNKRNALAWAEYKALMPILYEFHDNTVENMAFGGDSGDIDRAYNQPRSVAHVQVRNGNDRAEWVAPSEGPFDHSLKSCESTRDEMHRVVHQMARSASNNSISSRKSGESKAMDENSTNIVLEALGDLMRDFAVCLIRMVEKGRGDKPSEWLATGMSNFQSRTLSAILNQESVLDNQVIIPSPTFKTMRKLQIATRILGDMASEKNLEQIRSEISSFFSTEQELQTLGIPTALAGIETLGADLEREALAASGSSEGEESGRANKDEDTD